MDDSGEARLLAAAQSGSAEALTEIVRRQIPRIFDFLAAVSGNLKIAEALAGVALLDFAQRINRVRATEDMPPHVFRAAWMTLEEDGWFSFREPGTDAPAFTELSRRRAAVLDLVLRQGLSDSDLAAVLGVSSGSAALIRSRVVASATTDLGKNGSALIAAYRDVKARHPEPTTVAAIQRFASAARPTVLESQAGSATGAARSRRTPTRAVVFLALALGGLASLLALLLLAPMSPLALTRSNDGAFQAVAPGGTPTATPRVVVITVTVTAGAGLGTATASASATRAGSSASPGGTASPGGSGTVAPGTPSATATRTATATSSGSRTPTAAPPTPTRTATPTQVPPTPTPTATATPTVCAPRLQVFLGNPAQVSVPPGGQVVRVFNSDTCGGAPFVAAASGWLSVQPMSGAIAAFGSLDLQLSVTGTPEPGQTATLTIVGPANELTVIATFSR